MLCQAEEMAIKLAPNLLFFLLFTVLLQNFNSLQVKKSQLVAEKICIFLHLNYLGFFWSDNTAFKTEK